MTNWSRYLESLCNTYAQWWRVYTITDVVGRQKVESEPSPLLFDFGLMVQTVKRDREERGKEEEKIERLSVLEGLRKYASDHVLLVGRPGSGKSTALALLLLEEAGKANLTPPTPLPCEGRGELECSPLLAGEGQGERSIGHSNQPKIPVLVKLRYYRTSILDLIQDFLQRHDPNLKLDAETLKTWLRQGELLLLVDGVNELPSDEARRDLHKFRQDYQKTTPMIFTTRDLGVGGDLDIAQKLEMQPLSEPQMQQFVRAYLPEQGDEMLRQLGSRLREFGQTPLLLMMLCSVFADNRNRVPSNLGSVFRRFTQIYTNKLKQDIPVSDQFRDWCPRLLEHLAWVMTAGEALSGLQVAIPKRQAEAVLTKFLQDKVPYPEKCTLSWLKDLLNHHLMQLGAGEQIEFRHQLIQEYYTAESLLKLLPSLGDDQLKREYLNYLKWTEPLALMLELVEDEAQAVRVVKLSLQVDLRLGARLAGAVKAEWQGKTVDLVVGLGIPQLLKIQLLEITKSEKAIPELVKVLNDGDFGVHGSAAYALGKIDSDAAITELFKALNHEDSTVRRSAVNALGNIGSEAAIRALGEALKDENSDVRWSAVSTLGDIGSETAILELVKALEHENSDVRLNAATELLGIDNTVAVNASNMYFENREIDSSLSDEEDAHLEATHQEINQAQLDVFWDFAYTSEIEGDDAAVDSLIKALQSQDLYIRYAALARLGTINNEKAVNTIIIALQDEISSIRIQVVYALSKNGSDAAVPQLITALNDEVSEVRSSAAYALGKIASPALLPDLYLRLKTDKETKLLDTISAIQERCKFYNYTLTQLPQMEDKPKSDVKRDQVFISYSHKDTKWLDKLQTMLKPMMRNNTISVWADTAIKPGSKWRAEIEKALASANVAVLMVSQNFLASDFITKHELPPLLNAAEQEGLKIIWVPVSYCLHEETEIGEYQAAHTPSQPLQSLKGAKLDQVLVKICQEIKAASAAT